MYLPTLISLCLDFFRTTFTKLKIITALLTSYFNGRNVCGDDDDDDDDDDDGNVGPKATALNPAKIFALSSAPCICMSAAKTHHGSLNCMQWTGGDWEPMPVSPSSGSAIANAKQVVEGGVSCFSRTIARLCAWESRALDLPIVFPTTSWRGNPTTQIKYSLRK